MGGALGVLLYRWKSENASLLILVVGLFMGFLLAFLRRSATGGK
jgi:hypothetical protein